MVRDKIKVWCQLNVNTEYSDHKYFDYMRMKAHIIIIAIVHPQAL